jgi:hypothetical protein
VVTEAQNDAGGVSEVCAGELAAAAAEVEFRAIMPALRAACDALDGDALRGLLARADRLRASAIKTLTCVG